MSRVSDRLSDSSRGDTGGDRPRSPVFEGTALDRFFRKVRLAAGAGLAGAVLGGIVGAPAVPVGLAVMGSEEIGLILGLGLGVIAAAFYKAA